MLDLDRLEEYSRWANEPIDHFFSGHIGISNLLQRTEVHTVGSLLVHTADELYAVRGVGSGTIRTIRSALGERELYLREPWRKRSDAIRYTYRHPPQAPASTILPLNLEPTRIMRQYNVRILNDFRGMSAQDLSDGKTGTGRTLDATSIKSMVDALVGLKIIQE